MTSALIIVMSALVIGAVVLSMSSSKGIFRSLSVPVCLGFFYTAVLQAWDSIKNPPADLSLADIESAVQIAVLSFVCFFAGYLIRQRPSQPLCGRELDFTRLRRFASAISLLGMFGFLTVIVTAGGPVAYFGRGYWESNVYQELSGYLYALKYFVQVGMALAIIARAHRQLGTWADLLLIAGFAMFGVEAIKLGDRGDLIRISALFCGWVILRPGRSNAGHGTTLWRWAVVGMAGLIVCVGVLVFPYIRGPERNVFDSDTGIYEAVRSSANQRGASRFGTRQGGEFDYAARIRVGIREGLFSHPGPAPLLRFFWNLIPRHLMPEKHEIFARFVGDRYYAMTELRSYDGCAPTGWGESYGLMGWSGVIVYWFLFGLGVKRLEESIPDPAIGLVAAMVFFLPLTQFVVMECWAGLMNVFYVVIPFLGALWISTRRDGIPTGEDKPSSRVSSGRKPVRPSLKSRNRRQASASPVR